MLSGNDDDWDANGLIVRTYNAPEYPDHLTPKGWESEKYVTRCPTSWPEPHCSSPLLNIPDNAHASWLHEIGMFCHYLEGWDPKYVKQWIVTATRLTNMGREYQDAQIARNLKGYDAVLKAVSDSQIRERIRFIENELHRPKTVKVPTVEFGATVRFHTGVDTAVVMNIKQVPRSRYGDDGSCNMVFLHKPINGSDVHYQENLIAVDFPPTTPEE